MNFIKNKTVGSILYIILSFILSVCLVACGICSLIRFSVFTPGFLLDCLNGSAYYTDLCDEITDDLLNIGDASGLDKSFFENFVDEVLVREDIQKYVEDFYAGNKMTVDTTNFEESLDEALAKYQSENNITDAPKESLDYFVKEAAKIYAQNIKITYFNSIQKKMLEYKTKFTLYSIASGILALAIAAFIFFTSEWKHKAFRYFYYSICGAGLFTLLIPAAVFASGILGKIAILSRSLNDMYTAVFNSLFVEMAICAAAMFIVSLILLIVHGKLRKKVTED
ncbi:MAG: hypothetical protein J1E96_02170 [Ruminococcus sp.]|nr:hypothetical protein [Ruminococcus sp.]